MATPPPVSPVAIPAPPLVLVQEDAGFLAFQRPLAVLEARAPREVPSALERADEALAAGRYLAGYLAYEAASGFGLPVRDPDPDGPPLLWLGVFDEPAAVALVEPRPAPASAPLDWRPALDDAGYEAAVASLHERIARGDTYQVNFTFPLLAAVREEPLALFARLVAAQRPRHAAFVDLGRFAIASASPELFFERHGDRLRARPMKGTAARGLTAAEDQARAQALRSSEKERAENLMIVDMLRNDLGRIAELGSVAVASLFEVERYPTLLQMTSTLSARSTAPLSVLLRSLFPCASVTGAPRESTMRLIAAHEAAPRGVYTGTVGWAGPGGRAHFNVAIRTAVVDRERRSLAFGVGSGIVADSTAARERAECLLKARILDEPPFALVETMAFLPGEGFRRLEGHLARLAGSARHFGFPLDGRAVERALRRAAACADGGSRVRLLLGGDGRVATETEPLPARPTRPLRVGLAARPVDPARAWLLHKTSRREVYDEARASRPDCDDVLLWNGRGEATEASAANVIFDLPGGRVTPPVSCGLLPGVERARAVAEGRAREGVVRLNDLHAGMRLWLVSALRGVREAVLVE